MSESLRTIIEKRRDEAQTCLEECRRALAALGLPDGANVISTAHVGVAKPMRSIKRIDEPTEKPAKRVVSEATKAKMRAAHAERRALKASAAFNGNGNGAPVAEA